MKLNSNNDAVEGEFHIISVHDISSKQNKMALRPWMMILKKYGDIVGVVFIYTCHIYFFF